MTLSPSFRIEQYELGDLICYQYKDYGAWKNARKYSLTASESASLTGDSCYTSHEEWLDEKTGRTEREEFTERAKALVDCGSELEPFIKYRLEWEHPELKGNLIECSKNCMYARLVRSRSGNAFWVSATPDLMIRDIRSPSRAGRLAIRVGGDETPGPGAPVELKVSSPYLWRKEPPSDYPSQLQHQMLVLNRHTGMLAALLSDARKREKYSSMSRSEALELFCESSLRTFHFEQDKDQWIKILQAADRVSLQLQEVYGQTPSELRF